MQGFSGRFLTYHGWLYRKISLENISFLSQSEDYGLSIAKDSEKWIVILVKSI